MTELVTKIMSGDRLLPKPQWALRNGIRRSRMLDVLSECTTGNDEKRPAIGTIKKTVNAAANEMLVVFLKSFLFSKVGLAAHLWSIIWCR